MGKWKQDIPYLCAGVLRVAVQVGQHTGEGVDVGVYLGVIARRLLRTTVLQEGST